MLDGLQANKTGLMPTVSFFFEGMRKMFTANEGLNIGYVKNNTCTCVRLMLDSREPQDDGLGDVWMLRYHPVAEIVRPDIIDVGATILPAFPGCIAVVPITPLQGFKLALPQPMALTPGGKTVTNVTIHRFGMAMDTADVVTDYWTQGMSFLRGLFIIDLTPPATGGPMKGPSIRVPLSRYSSYNDIKLFRPLWSTTSEKHIVVDKLWAALKPDKVIMAERHRLEDLANATALRHAGLLAKHGL